LLTRYRPTRRYPPSPTDLIRILDAARLIDTHPGTIRRWLRSGRLRGYRRVGRYLVSKADVLGLVQPIDVDAERVERNAARREEYARLPASAAELARNEAWVDAELKRMGIRK
jgi:excisionase family DNA binding protein